MNDVSLEHLTRGSRALFDPFMSSVANLLAMGDTNMVSKF